MHFNTDRIMFIVRAILKIKHNKLRHVDLRWKTVKKTVERKNGADFFRSRKAIAAYFSSTVPTTESTRSTVSTFRQISSFLWKKNTRLTVFPLNNFLRHFSYQA